MTLGDLGFHALERSKRRAREAAQCSGAQKRSKHEPSETKVRLLKLLPDIAKCFLHTEDNDDVHDASVVSSWHTSCSLVVRCPPCGIFHASHVTKMIATITAGALSVTSITAYGFSDEAQGHRPYFVGAGVEGALVVGVSSEQATAAATPGQHREQRREQHASDAGGSRAVALGGESLRSDLARLSLAQGNKCRALLAHLARHIDADLDEVHASLCTSAPVGCADGTLFIRVHGPVCFDLLGVFMSDERVMEASVFRPSTGELHIRVE